MIVAIDGPAAAGKGTVGRALAARLGWRYLDTGAMYRAIALAVLDRVIAPDDSEGAARVARSVDIAVDGDHIHLDGVDVSQRVRTPQVTRAVSAVAAHPAVREVLVARQRDLLETAGDVVMEGRDIGTTVAPQADLKVFLTAALDERARRRARQLALEEDAATLGKLQRELAERDDADADRSASPFRKADDALEVDSTGRRVEEIVDEIAALVERVRDGRRP